MSQAYFQFLGGYKVNASIYIRTRNIRAFYLRLLYSWITDEQRIRHEQWPDCAAKAVCFNKDLVNLISEFLPGSAAINRRQ
jgi:hypothetical protein